MRIKEIKKDSVCEGCGTTGSYENSLGNWMYYNFQNKIMCSNCTEKESQRVLKLVDDMISGKVKRK